MWVVSVVSLPKSGIQGGVFVKFNEKLVKEHNLQQIKCILKVMPIEQKKKGK